MDEWDLKGQLGGQLCCSIYSLFFPSAYGITLKNRVSWGQKGETLVSTQTSCIQTREHCDIIITTENTRVANGKAWKINTHTHTLHIFKHRTQHRTGDCSCLKQDIVLGRVHSGHFLSQTGNGVTAREHLLVFRSIEPI